MDGHDYGDLYYCDSDTLTSQGFGVTMNHSFRLGSLALAFGMATACAGQVNSVTNLDQTRLGDVPLEFENAPLTTALGRIGVSVKDDFVLFGIEVLLERGQEPTVTSHIAAGSTLRGALTAVIQAVPGYTFEAVGPHLIDFFPLRTENDPDSMLNVQIPKLSVINVSPGNFIGNPARYLPELKAALTRGKPGGCQIGPGFSDKAPGVTLQAQNVSVRSVLNLVSRASIASAQQNRGAAFGWVYLHEEFPSEIYPADSWRAHDVWDPGRRGKR